jgi:hypothetical protein
LGACGSFFTPASSFVEYQRRLQHTQGHHNAQTLFDVEPIPCDNPGRKRLDPIAPSYLDAVFLEGFAGIETYRMLAHFRVLGDQLLVALDGTNSFSSTAMHCPTWLTRQRTNGHPLDDHAAITPVIVCPGQSQVMALPPEYIMPPDGHDQQDWARAAGKRWLAIHAEQVAPHGVPLGDFRKRLYSVRVRGQSCSSRSVKRGHDAAADHHGQWPGKQWEAEAMFAADGGVVRGP